MRSFNRRRSWLSAHRARERLPSQDTLGPLGLNAATRKCGAGCRRVPQRIQEGSEISSRRSASATFSPCLARQTEQSLSSLQRARGQVETPPIYIRKPLADRESEAGPSTPALKWGEFRSMKRRRPAPKHGSAHAKNRTSAAPASVPTPAAAAGPSTAPNTPAGTPPSRAAAAPQSPAGGRDPATPRSARTKAKPFGGRGYTSQFRGVHQTMPTGALRAAGVGGRGAGGSRR